MSKRTTVIGRWDTEVLRKCREIVGKEITTADLSRIMYNSSMFRLEHKLGSMGKKKGSMPEYQRRKKQ